ncbi:hypothetical protein ABIB26_000309 [Arthrobacter sp. UYEF20]
MFHVKQRWWPPAAGRKRRLARPRLNRVGGPRWGTLRAQEALIDPGCCRRPSGATRSLGYLRRASPGIAAIFVWHVASIRATSSNWVSTYPHRAGLRRCGGSRRPSPGILSRDGERLAHEINPAELPGCVRERRPDGLLQPRGASGMKKLHAGRPAGIQRPQECGPERFVFAVADVEAKHFPPPVGGHTEGDHDRLGHDPGPTRALRQVASRNT